MGLVLCLDQEARALQRRSFAHCFTHVMTSDMKPGEGSTVGQESGAGKEVGQTRNVTQEAPRGLGSLRFGIRARNNATALLTASGEAATPNVFPE